MIVAVFIPPGGVVSVLLKTGFMLLFFNFLLNYNNVKTFDGISENYIFALNTLKYCEFIGLSL